MRQTVEFKSEGERIEAFLYTPDEGDGPFPIVVMAGGWCYVKELVQPAHAEVFSDAGLGALIFDYRTMGGSGGEPRQHIDPWAQIEDYKCAISFVETRQEFDSDRIGVWGISYSGGHVLILGATDPRVRSVVSVVPVIDGWQNLRLAHGTIGFRRILEAVVAHRRRRFESGEHSYLPHQPGSEGELATWPFPASRPVFKVLKETQAPAYEGRATTASTEMLLAYSVFPFVERLLDASTLMVVAEADDHTHWDLAMEAFDRIPSRDKRLEVVPRSTHLSLYQDESHVTLAARVGADWFVEHLAR